MIEKDMIKFMRIGRMKTMKRMVRRLTLNKSAKYASIWNLFLLTKSMVSIQRIIMHSGLVNQVIGTSDQIAVSNYPRDQSQRKLSSVENLEYALNA